jgi:hypothetical protein
MSTLKVNTLTDTAATKSVPIEDVVNGVARAWVNFNGTGTVAIRADYNVTDITDNGTGDYTVNFTNAMPDANYSVVFGVKNEGLGGASGANANAVIKVGTTPTSSSVVVLTGQVTTGSAGDFSFVNVVIFR